MIIIPFLFLAGSAQVLAQGLDHPNPFVYKGCATVDISCFSEPVAVANGQLTPKNCQNACQSHEFAALLPNECRCGDDASAITPTKESACDNPCMGDKKNGMCGSICQGDSPKIANVYCSTPVQQTSKAVAGPSVPAVSSLATEETCTTTPSPDPYGPQPTRPPAAPQSLQTLPAPPPLKSFTTLKSPCPSESSSTVKTPKQPNQGSSMEIGTPVPPAYPTPAKPPPALTPVSNPPKQSAECSIASAGSSSMPEVPEGYNCPDQAQADPSSTTVWSRPSEAAQGDPPVPSQVPGSDSTPAIIPPFSAIGGIALIAVFMI